VIDERIIEHYWQLAMQRRSLVGFDQDRLIYEFYLNENDFQAFPELRGAVYFALWEEGGKIQYRLE